MKDNNSNNNPSEIQEENSPEVKQELSKVATNPKQSLLAIAIVCLVVGYAAYYFFLRSDPDAEPKQAPIELPADVSKPVQVNANDIPPIPQLPDPPKLIAPPAPPVPTVAESREEALLPVVPPTQPIEALAPPPTAPLLPTTGTVPSQLVTSEAEQKRKEAKWQSTMILIAGNPNKKTPEQLQQEADFKERGNVELLLGRGKIIDAVLETAISTDFGGEVRAIVSRDVFSESGKVVLIPKGSRVFGEYSTTVDGAYGRIAVTWSRVDLSTGFSVQLAGPAVDHLGRKGVEGRVDNKYKEKIANSILMSAFNITLANTLDKITPPVQSSTAGTQNQAAASQLNNIAMAIFNNTQYTPAIKIQLICTQVEAAIPDKTSEAYTGFVAACNTATTNPGGLTPDQNLSAVMAAVNAASVSLLTKTDEQLTPTQAQEASKQAFTDITNTVKDILKQDQFKPTVTIDQGTPIKIYVTKDYNFPRKALNKKIIK